MNPPISHPGFVYWIPPVVISDENWLPAYYDPEYLAFEDQITENPEGFLRVGDFLRAHPIHLVETSPIDYQWAVVPEAGSAKVRAGAHVERKEDRFSPLPEEAILFPRLLRADKAEPAYWNEELFAGSGVGSQSLILVESSTRESLAWVYGEMRQDYFQQQLRRHTSGGTLPVISVNALSNLQVKNRSQSEREAAERLIQQEVRLLKEQIRLESIRTRSSSHYLLAGSTFEERREQFEELLRSEEFPAVPIAFVEATTSNPASDQFLANLFGESPDLLRLLSLPEGEDSEAAKSWREWYWDSSANPWRLFHSFAGSTAYSIPRSLMKRIAPLLVSIGESELGRRIVEPGAMSKLSTWERPLEKDKTGELLRIARRGNFQLPILGFKAISDLFPASKLGEGIEAFSEAREGLRKILGEKLASISEDSETLVDAVLSVNRHVFRPILALKVLRDGHPAGVYLICGNDQFDDPEAVRAQLEVLGPQLSDALEPPSEHVEEVTRRESLRRLSWFQHQINGPLMRGIRAIEDLEAFIRQHEEIAASLLPDEKTARARVAMNNQPLDSCRFDSRLAVAGKAFRDLRNLNYQIRKLRNAQSSSPHERVDLKPLLKALLDEAQHALASLRTSFDSRTDREILGDRQTLGDAFDEVVNNAIRELRERNVAHPEIQVQMWEEDGFVRVEIRDNGFPVESELMNGVFEEDASTYSSSGKGSGLGLAIVRETIRAHKGRCDLRENRDAKDRRVAGVIFTASIPVYTQRNTD